MDSTIDVAEHPADPAAAATPAQPSAEVAAVLEGAAELARQAVVEFSGDTVGAHLGVTIEDEAAATHRFLTTLTGYQGWQWAVVVAACPGAEHATVSEVVLVPGPTALLAPSWLPWDRRVKPGDLGPGDLLATPADDPRLVPGFLATGDPLIDDTAQELGFGRRRVLSAFGRADAAQRWHDGDHGPDAAMAKATKRLCRDCGFMVPLAGGLGAMFGVCCNELSADGQVVDFFYGCGAHSDTPAAPLSGSPAFEPFDDGVVEVVDVTRVVEVAAEAETETLAEETPAEEAVSEEEAGEEVAPVAEEPVAEPDAASEPEAAAEPEAGTPES
jgi:hypothetical protein